MPVWRSWRKRNQPASGNAEALHRGARGRDSRNGAVFLVSNGRAVRRQVKPGSTSVAQGVHIEEGLIGGEDLIVNPPADLKDGDRVKAKG